MLKSKFPAISEHVRLAGFDDRFVASCLLFLLLDSAVDMWSVARVAELYYGPWSDNFFNRIVQ